MSPALAFFVGVETSEQLRGVVPAAAVAVAGEVLLLQMCMLVPLVGGVRSWL